MEINFGTSVTNCAVIFDVNGNYGIQNTDMWIHGNNWNGQVAFPKGVTYSRLGSSRMFNSKVTIPSTVTNMSNMFFNCYNLNRSVAIPSGVLNIANAFVNAQRYNSPITLPNGVINISFMLRGANYNKPLAIPSSVTEARGLLMNDKSFNSSLVFEERSTPILVGSLFSGCNMFNQSYALPKSNSYDNAFESCHTLNRPIDISQLNGSASHIFKDCRNFNQSVVFPDTCTRFYGAFWNCKLFNGTVTFPNHTNFNSVADLFGNCYSFNTAFTLPIVSDNLTLSGFMANCNNYTHPVVIGANKYLLSGQQAFANCNKLSDISIYGQEFNWAGTGHSSMFRSNNAVRLNVRVQSRAYSSLLSYNIIQNGSGGIKPTWTNMSDGNGCYNTLYNIYVYNNLT